MTEPYDAERLRKCSTALGMLRDGLSVTHGSLGQAAKLDNSLKSIISITDEAATALAAQAEEIERLRADKERLDFLESECLDLRCFDEPTGGDDVDIVWRVIQHFQAEPRERVVSDVYNDDPRKAIDEAKAALGGKQDD